MRKIKRESEKYKELVEFGVKHELNPLKVKGVVRFDYRKLGEKFNEMRSEEEVEKERDSQKRGRVE